MADEHHAQRLVHLNVVSGPDKGLMYFLKPKKEALIGRAAAADLRLTDNGASQKHCMVRSAGDMIFIEDLQSSNGTSVNGERTDQRVLDENGQIEIGGTVIEVQWVETEKHVPLASVQSPKAPTLLDRVSKTAPIPRPSSAGSTISDAAQLQDFRAARALLGSSVGGYLLLETLGVNDLGVLFRAKALKSRDAVALTLIKPSSARSPELLARFLRDTRTTLKIPGAPQVLAAGSEGANAFIVMELTRGRDLAARVNEDQPLKPSEAVALTESIGAVLQEAHEQGVIHGDVRPVNILFSDGSGAGVPAGAGTEARPTILLLGLGLARRIDGEGRPIFVNKEEHRERLAFTCPELTLAKPSSPAADVYSLAATLYFALSGQCPYQAPTQLELVRKIRWEDPPLLSGLGREIPASLAEVIARGMAKESGERFATMREFTDALKASIPAG